MRLHPNLSHLNQIIEFRPHQYMQQDPFADLRNFIANGMDACNSDDDFTKKFRQILPDFVTLVISWGQKLKIASNASEQDFRTLLYAKLFEPLFQDLPSTRCSVMTLPVPFEKFKRLTDARSAVWKGKIEFVYFIREDSPAKEINEDHKDLHKLVQLMRCALRFQILHLKPSNERRTLYCFGILTSGYCVQLLQMQVQLHSENDYESPIYELWVEPELDLAEFDKASLTKLMTWLVAIRAYHFKLENLLESWTVLTTARKLMKDKSDDSDYDSDEQDKFDPAPNNQNTNQ